MGLGDLWDNSTNNQAALDRLNAKTLHELTGAQIAALGSGDVNKGTLVYCNTSGSGYTAGLYYGRNSANNGCFIAAGSFREHLADGITTFLWLNYEIYNANMIIAETGSGGVIVSNTSTGGAEAQTGTTINGYGNGAKEGMNFSFANDAKILMKADTTPSSPTQWRARAGVAMERADSADTTSRKLGIQNDTTGTGANWSVASADGTTRSTTLSGRAPGSVDSYKLEFLTGASLKFSYNGTLDTTKTTNIPSSSTNGAERVFSFGAQTKDTSGKTFLMVAFEVIGRKGDTF